MIVSKITLTTVCGAQCKSCPNWKNDNKYMPMETFIKIFDKLNNSPHVSKIILNNVGDLYCHPQHIEILKYVEKTKKTKVSMTTNAAILDYIPMIDELIISFNGGTKEAYEKVTGLSYDKVLQNIKDNVEDIRQKPKAALIHCLIFEDNKETELDLIDIFTNFPGDMMFPGKIRISYKYDNQFGEDLTLEKYKNDKRIYCDYLNQISVHVDGSVILCAHDFGATMKMGNILTDSIYDIMRNKIRESKRFTHLNGRFQGLCEKCNHNMTIAGRIYEAILR